MLIPRRIAETMHDDVTEYLEKRIEAEPDNELELVIMLLDHAAGRREWLARATGEPIEPKDVSTEWTYPASE